MMNSRLRRWDDTLERLFARVLPPSCGPYDGPGAGMIGIGVAQLALGLFLVAVFSVAGRGVVVPLVNAALGLCFLILGVRQNRKVRGG